ncbi:tetratricopeptide repeat protein [Arthrobacter sp. JSM 101049]|uniref:tetratricopeptide repeat protein n=1 Tax=Arthrobacter sp. JSM 101049 TaxID=929097 RepID=UPI0035686F79
MSNSEPAAASSRGAVDLSGLGAQNPAAGMPAAASGAPAGGSTWTTAVNQQDFTQLVQLSSTAPVVVSLGTGASPASAQLDATLRDLVDGYAGRLVLALVDTDREPAIAQAFRVQQVPSVVALLNGQPVPLFQGAAAPEQISSLLQELLQLGVQHGVTGTVPAFGGEPAEQPVPPLHQEALDAIDAGDYDGAIAAYRKALAEKPNDDEAQTGLQHVELLRRTADADLQAVRDAAAQYPEGIDEQLAVADLDVLGGHVEDAFARLVSLVGRTTGEDRERIRARLVSLYAVVGTQDERVTKSRQRLARVLF